jgi:putative oxidoreductase
VLKGEMQMPQAASDPARTSAETVETRAGALGIFGRLMRLGRLTERWLEPGEKTKKLMDPLFRLLTSLIFIVGGIGHFRQHDVMLARMEESPWQPTVKMVGDPSMLLWLSGAAFIAAAFALVLGWMTRLSALVLFFTLIPVTIAIHVVPDTSHVGPLFKNIAILGALLFFWSRGPGAYARDNRLPPTAPDQRT